MILSYLPLPAFFVTRMTSSPSSMTVLAKTAAPSFFCTARGSPVMDDWFTIASPPVTMPSSGIMFPVRATISCPACTWLIGVRTSCPFSAFSQTLSTCRDMAFARSSRDFFLVHSSMMSPMPSRNMTLDAVSKSPCAIAIVTEAASRTCTSSLPFPRDFSALKINGIARTTLIAIRMGAGRKKRIA